MKITRLFKVFPLLIMLFLCSCERFLEENEENGKYNDETVWNSAKLAEGVLLRSYSLIPANYAGIKDDWATDDMATNLMTDNSRIMAMGGWTSRINPVGNYSDCYVAILHINDFLEHVDNVVWAWDDQVGDSEERNEMYKKRLKGEAYALRAWWSAELLRTVGGKDEQGNLLGFPIVTSVIKDVEMAKLPRNTYRQCLDQILEDCDRALTLLPLRWTDQGLTGNMKTVYGAGNVNRINGLTVELLKSRVLLAAASPAFQSSNITWQQAAEAAAKVLIDNYGLTKLDAKDIEYYKQTDLTYLNSATEVLWYTSISTNASSLEANLFPPSLYGKGRMNPSQNFVDCFPDANGYPIDHASSLYNALNPYNSRDSRLDKYVYRNGSKTTTNKVVNTMTGDDAIGGKETSTRTGYYLRKFNNENVNLTPGSVTGAIHFFTFARYTEALLNFAEAANEAVGPDVAINGFTARQVITAIRTRAGLSASYSNSCDKDQLGQLIRNERRIELSFEGFRFWDLRRWEDKVNMNKTVRGISYGSDSSISYFDVENRTYQDYMIYPPVPYTETMKYDLIQNAGW